MQPTKLTIKRPRHRILDVRTLKHKLGFIVHTKNGSMAFVFPQDDPERTCNALRHMHLRIPYLRQTDIQHNFIYTAELIGKYIYGYSKEAVRDGMKYKILG